MILVSDDHLIHRDRHVVEFIYSCNKRLVRPTQSPDSEFLAGRMLRRRVQLGNLSENSDPVWKVEGISYRIDNVFCQKYDIFFIL